MMAATSKVATGSALDEATCSEATSLAPFATVVCPKLAGEDLLAALLVFWLVRPPDKAIRPAE